MGFKELVQFLDLVENIETWIEKLHESSSVISSEEDLDTIIRRCEWILKDSKRLKQLIKEIN